MRNDYIHITMVIDKSGSMYRSVSDVKGGVSKIIDEQKEKAEGKCTISLYTFNDKVDEDFVGVDVKDVPKFNYSPMGNTAMNDGIGTAIDKTGKWLADMNEEDRPGKVLLAIFTDGMENASKEYTIDDVKEKIKHQESVYSWNVIYLGTDITTVEAAEKLGIKTRTYSSRGSMSKNYDVINNVTSSYRAMATMDWMSPSDASASFNALLSEETVKNTKLYEEEIGRKIENV